MIDQGENPPLGREIDPEVLQEETDRITSIFRSILENPKDKLDEARGKGIYITKGEFNSNIVAQRSKSQDGAVVAIQQHH